MMSCMKNLPFISNLKFQTRFVNEENLDDSLKMESFAVILFGHFGKLSSNGQRQYSINQICQKTLGIAN